MDSRSPLVLLVTHDILVFFFTGCNVGQVKTLYTILNKVLCTVESAYIIEYSITSGFCISALYIRGFMYFNKIK